MRYRHKKSGAVIEIASELRSPDWTPIPERAPAEDTAQESAPPKPRKRTVKPDAGTETVRRGQ